MFFFLVSNTRSGSGVKASVPGLVRIERRSGGCRKKRRLPLKGPEESNEKMAA